MQITQLGGDSMHIYLNPTNTNIKKPECKKCVDKTMILEHINRFIDEGNRINDEKKYR